MKIAILYHSKYGNTKALAEYMSKMLVEKGNEVKLFNAKKTKPAELVKFKPVAILVGGPTHFGKPVKSLIKYIEKLGKNKDKSMISKAAVFNCYTGDIVCENIKHQISEALPKIEVFENALPIRTGGENAENWKEVSLQDDWKELTDNFLSSFLNFLT